jgi:hypothetical protein
MLWASSVIFCLLGGVAEISAILCALPLFAVYAYFGLGAVGLHKGDLDLRAKRIADIFGKLFLSSLALAVVFYFAVLAIGRGF